MSVYLEALKILKTVKVVGIFSYQVVDVAYVFFENAFYAISLYQP